MNVTYQDVAISYNEDRNEWTADDYRPKASLALMKAAIDRKLDSPDSKEKFKRFDALYIHNGRIERLTITSICEDGGVRVKRNGGNEKLRDFYVKQYLRRLDAESEPLAARYTELSAQIETLRNEQESIHQKLKPITLKND